MRQRLIATVLLVAPLVVGVGTPIDAAEAAAVSRAAVTSVGATPDASAAGGVVAAAHPEAGTYVPLEPARVLDTRGPGRTAVPSRGSTRVQVLGAGGVAPVGVSSVVLNVTATQPRASGWITVRPAGESSWTTSSLNFGAGQTVANAVVVRVPDTGFVEFANGSAGDVHVVADVAGFYRGGQATVPGSFAALPPTRVLDTRAGSTRVAGGASVTIPPGSGGLPRTGVSAVVLNVTVIEPVADGWIVVYPTGPPPPPSSSLTYRAGSTTATLALGLVGSDGSITLTNGGPAPVHLIADVAGYVLAGTASSAGTLSPIVPSRLVDTRSGLGATMSLPSRGRLRVPVRGVAGIPTTGVGAVVLTVTVTRAKAPGWLTVFPAAVEPPGVSTLNVEAGSTVTNLAIVAVGMEGSVELFNGAEAPVDVIVDITGYVRTPQTPPLQAQKVSAADHHTCAVTTTGTVVCWGANWWGQLGTANTQSSPVPQPVVGLPSGIRDIATGSRTTCALTGAGGVLCWGFNLGGRWWDDINPDISPLPRDVPGLTRDVSSISMAGDSACALSIQGTVSCWGSGGSIGGSDTPVPVQGLPPGIRSVSVAGPFACVVTHAGAVWCWGAVDVDADEDWRTPREIPGFGYAQRLSTGVGFVCATASDGLARCRGVNRQGQLGDGTTTTSATPVVVRGLPPGTRRIDSGSQHTCAVTVSGGAVCWGGNDAGQLGTGDMQASVLPVGVHGLTSGVYDVAAGAGLSCAVTATRSVRCWGVNSYGQLGNGTTDSSYVPTTVSGF